MDQMDKAMSCDALLTLQCGVGERKHYLHPLNGWSALPELTPPIVCFSAWPSKKYYMQQPVLLNVRFSLPHTTFCSIGSTHGSDFLD